MVFADLLASFGGDYSVEDVAAKVFFAEWGESWGIFGVVLKIQLVYVSTRDFRVESFNLRPSAHMFVLIHRLFRNFV